MILAVAALRNIATIQTIREERLLENVRARGEQLITELSALSASYPVIADVRGLGLMIGSISHGIKGLLTGLDGGMYLVNSGLEETMITASGVRSNRFSISASAGAV